jgi:hypothetical protein
LEVWAGYKRPGLAQARQTGCPRRFVVGFGPIVLGAPAGVACETPSAPHTSPSAGTEACGACALFTKCSRNTSRVLLRHLKPVTHGGSWLGSAPSCSVHPLGLFLKPCGDGLLPK